MITAYYNEFDPKAAAWLKELIKAGAITPGEVDDRSMTDVTSNDIRGFDRVHWFAGVGTWDYALNESKWGDRPVWTASLPCQPFSSAGKRQGYDDERHLLPHFIDLFRECKPELVIGEQVERAVKFGWLDDLCSSMERENYAVGAVVLGAHSAGAAHQRQRLYWLADANSNRRQSELGYRSTEKRGERIQPAGIREQSCSIRAAFNELAHAHDSRSQGRIQGRADSERETLERLLECNGAARSMGDTQHEQHEGSLSGYGQIPREDKRQASANQFTGPSQSLEWIYCRDNKYRPTKSGLRPLVNGTPADLVRGGNTGAPIEPDNSQEARAMRLKGYGNAIQADTAKLFIHSAMEILNYGTHATA